MKYSRASKYKAEKKRLMRIVNNYTKEKALEFIQGAASLYTQANMIE